MADKEIRFVLKGVGDFSDIQSNVQTVQKAINQLQLPKNLKTSFVNVFDSLDSELVKFQKHLDSGFKKKSDVTGLEQSGERIIKLFKQLEINMQQISDKDISKSFKLSPKDLEEANRKITEATEQWNKKFQELGQSKNREGVTVLEQLSKAADQIKSKGKTVEEFKKALTEGNYSTAATAIENMSKNMTKFSGENQEAAKHLIDVFNNLANSPGMETVKTKLKEAVTNASNINQIKLTEAQNQFNNLSKSVTETNNSLKDYVSKKLEAARATFDLGSQLDQMSSRVNYFFGLANGVQLFKRALRQAYNSVKELDEVMTETAVVTDFTIGDMWAQLPKYTKNANKLGVSVKGMYEASTLYYQQGLKSNEVTEMATETLKMAKIANIEAEEATKAMTAAVRGFNMEINEMSAQKVNDVYSTLAAITAADTEGLATAMSKTASIASSANMELETTSAFLAQIIETTQEAPETAGTALKTIIARFSEVKKLVDQGSLTGEDEEGEAIDVNRIDTALKTVGISMNNFFAGTEGLDSVLLKLAEKWDTLDFSTQRYIATTAAGSRQQSRFIAMMSDYARTMELVEAAENSAGASNKQFEKTLDSLESKTARLKNTYNEFTMGIADSGVIKGGVDVLNGFLKVVNGITGALPGPLNGISKLALGFATLKAGAVFLPTLLTGMKELKNGASMMQILGNSFSATGKSFSNLKVLINKNFWAGPSKQSLENFKYFNNLISNNSIAMSNMIKFNKHQMLDYFEKMSAGYILNAGQLQTVTLLEEKSIPIGLSKMAAINGITKETIEQAGAEIYKKAALKDLNEEEIENIILEEMLKKQKNGTLKLEKQSIIFKAKETLALAFGNKERRATAMANLGIASTTKIAEGSVKGFNATLLSSPIGWWIAAIAILVIGVIHLAKAIETNEEKTKRLNERLGELKESFEAAKEAQDQLLETKDGYDTLQSKLENLTKGSQEWKEALIDVNSQVLDLLKTYPQLSEYISTGKYGEMTISQEGWDMIIEEQQRRVQNIASEKTAAQLQLTAVKIDDLEDEIAQTESNLNNILQQGNAVTTIQYKGEDGTSYSYEQPATAEFLKGSDELLIELLTNTELLEKKANELGAPHLVDDLESAIVATLRLRNEIKGQEVLFQSQLESGIRSSLDIVTIQNEYSDEIISGITKAISPEKIENKLKNVNISSVAQQYGLAGSNENFVLSNANLKDLYKEMTGATDEELKGKNNKWLQEAIKSAYVFSDMADGVKEFTEKLDKIPADKAAEITNKFSQDLGNIKLSESVKAINKEQIEEWAQQLDMSADQLAKIYGFDSVSQAISSINNSINDFNKTLATQESLLEHDYKLDNSTIAKMASVDNAEDLTMSQYEGFVEAINSVAQQGGNLQQFTSTISRVSEAIKTGLSGAKESDALTILAETDFSKAESIESTINALEDMGIELDENMTRSLIEVARATKNLNLETLENKLSKLGDTAEKVTDKVENGIATFNKEEIESLQASGIYDRDDFVRTGIEEWTYIGGTTNDLLEQIKQTELDILSEMGEDINEAVLRGQNIEDNKYLLKETTFGTGKDALTGYDDIIKGIINGAITADNIDKTTLKDLKNFATQADIVSDAEAKTYSDEAFLARLASEDVYYQDLEQNRIKKQEFEQDQQQLTLTQSGTGQGVLETGEVIGATKEQQDQALSALAAQYPGFEATLGAVNKALEEQGNYIEENGNAYKAHAVDISKQQKEVKKLSQVISDNSDVLSEGRGEMGEFNTEYNQAIESVWTSAKSVFGENLSSDFVEAHINDFLALEKGGQEAVDAFENIQNELIKNYFETTTKLPNMTEESTSRINNALLNIIDEVKINGTFDPSEILANAQLTKEEMASLASVLESFGYSVTYSTKTMYRDDYTGALYDNKAYDYLKEVEVVDKVSVVSNTGGSGLYNSGSKGGGGGSSDKADTWENPYDEIYNLTQKLNEELRERENLEKDYDRLLKDRKTTYEDLQDNQLDQIANLRKQQSIQQQIVDEYKNQLNKAGKETYADDEGNEKTFEQWGVTKYAKYENGVLTVDWEGLEKLKDDPEKGGAAEAYISYLEEVTDGLEEAEDTILDIEDEIEEIKDKNQEAYLDFEQEVYDALVQQRQTFIDNYQELSDTIADSNSDIIDSMRESIELERQIRDNTKTEEDIAEKEARLAFLKRDTSGANQQEILTLEKELEEDRLSYGDTLVDQHLDNLEDANTKAQEQRQKQIDLMQAQLDYQEKSGYFWSQVTDLISGKEPGLQELLEEANNTDGMSHFGEANWEKNFITDLARAQAGLSDWKVEQAEKTGTQKIKGGTTLYYHKGKWYDKENGKGSEYTDFTYDVKTDTYTAKKKTEPVTPSNPDSGKNKPEKTDSTEQGNYKDYTVKSGDTLSQIASKFGVKNWKDIYNDNKDTIERVAKEHDYDSSYEGTMIWPGTKLRIRQFKTGGLADYTGPAWLDGTKSKPEIVLNAQDTKNFIQLRDILSSILDGRSKEAQNNGDNYYEFNINIEEIGDDYDVDQMVERLKERIHEDASYRNVNAINFIR